jgi:hypothetical protein
MGRHLRYDVDDRVPDLGPRERDHLVTVRSKSDSREGDPARAKDPPYRRRLKADEKFEARDPDVTAEDLAAHAGRAKAYCLRNCWFIAVVAEQNIQTGSNGVLHCRTARR